MEHILGGERQSLMETALRGLKKAWILEAFGPFLSMLLKDQLLSCACISLGPSTTFSIGASISFFLFKILSIF